MGHHTELMSNQPAEVQNPCNMDTLAPTALHVDNTAPAAELRARSCHDDDSSWSTVAGAMMNRLEAMGTDMQQLRVGMQDIRVEMQQLRAGVARLLHRGSIFEERGDRLTLSSPAAHPFLPQPPPHGSPPPPPPPHDDELAAQTAASAAAIMGRRESVDPWPLPFHDGCGVSSDAPTSTFVATRGNPPAGCDASRSTPYRSDSVTSFTWLAQQGLSPIEGRPPQVARGPQVHSGSAAPPDGRGSRSSISPSDSLGSSVPLLLRGAAAPSSSKISGHTSVPLPRTLNSHNAVASRPASHGERIKFGFALRNSGGGKPAATLPAASTAHPLPPSLSTSGSSAEGRRLAVANNDCSKSPGAESMAQPPTVSVPRSPAPAPHHAPARAAEGAMGFDGVEACATQSSARGTGALDREPAAAEDGIPSSLPLSSSRSASTISFDATSFSSGSALLNSSGSGGVAGRLELARAQRKLARQLAADPSCLPAPIPAASNIVTSDSAPSSACETVPPPSSAATTASTSVATS